jgi:hypothetical protein
MDHVHVMSTLNRVLNAINARSRVYMRHEFVSLANRKSLLYTALVFEHSIRILLRIDRMHINPCVDSQASLADARLRMARMFENMTADRNFPRNCLEMHSYGVPTFLVRGLMLSDFDIHEVCAIINCVVGVLDVHGECISPSFASDALLQRLRRMS